jgi:hypothetical protein
MKIAPGIRLNLTKKGISARVGPRGLGVTTGTSGTTVSAGIPGSGLHVSQKVKAAPSQKARSETESANKPATQGLGLFGWIGVAVIGFGILWIIS